jgi:hypothetical protein
MFILQEYSKTNPIFRYRKVSKYLNFIRFAASISIAVGKQIQKMVFIIIHGKQRSKTSCFSFKINKIRK